MSYKGNVIGVLVVSLDWSGESLSGPTAYSDVPMRGWKMGVYLEVDFFVDQI